MSKKNLDKLFREKFKDFEDVPDEKVWNAIETSLNKKRKKRVIPLWWKLGGVAAVLALALVIWNPLSSDLETTSTITLTDKDENDGADIKKEEQEETLKLPETTNEAVVEKASDERSLEAESNSEISNGALTESVRDDVEKEKNKIQSQVVANEKSSLANGNGSLKSTERKANSSFNSKEADLQGTQLTTTENRMDSDSEKDGSIIPAEEASDILNDQNKEAVANVSVAKSENIISESIPNTKDDIGVAQTKNAGQNSDSKQIKSDTTEEKVVQNDSNPDDSETEIDPKKKSIFEEIEAQNEETAIAEEPQGRWSAGPSIAPVYFNAVGEGSPVHSIFAPNSKSGNTNLSYGLSVAYEVNKKLRIRSGIHRVDYGYDTDEVAFSSSLQAVASERIENIDYTTTAKNLVVNSRASSLSSAEAPTNDVAFEVSEANSASRNGTMAQQFGYLEVPLELDYALIDRKFGVNLVGGFSSLFLLNNSVTLNSGDLTTEIGEANNVNNVNFSTNIGFGVNYKFSSKVRLNIEPVFKYQLNTFSDIAGDFRPFSVGVYSGLNFRF